MRSLFAITRLTGNGEDALAMRARIRVQFGGYVYVCVLVVDIDRRGQKWDELGGRVARNPTECIFKIKYRSLSYNIVGGFVALLC